MSESLFGELSRLPREPHALTIGSFDGVHRGHKHLLGRLSQRAGELDVPSLAITFDPLPAEILRPDSAPSRLCTTEDRTREIFNAGIDRIVVLRFDQEMANQSADAFLNAVLEYSMPQLIIVGEDFAFGHKRQGTPDFLRERSREHGFDLEIVKRVNPDSQEWSSSAVRRALAEHGDVKAAEEILGRPFGVSGTVQNGDRRGRDLGYPTANLEVPDRLTLPADGIYAALVNSGETDASIGLPALVYVGTRPTFDGTERHVEVYLLDFSGDLYGRRLAVEFVDRIRGDQKFESADELVEQMQRDEESGRRIFAGLGIEVAAPER